MTATFMMVDVPDRAADDAMPGMVQLLAVRHGETTLNAAGRLTGQLDPPLTARGREQGAGLAPLLAAGGFDAVVHSGTLRTAQTLAAAGVPGPWRVDARFLERSFGALEGEPAARWTEAGDVAAAPPGGGETYAALAARVAAALGDLEGRVLLCAHSGVLRVLRALSGEARDAAAFLDGAAANGAVLHMAYDNAPAVPAFLTAPAS
jgi:broad specificity phosphatase PhoE